LLNTHLFFKGKEEICDGFVIGVRRNGLQVLVPKYGLESVVVVKPGAELVLDPESGTVITGDGIQLRLLDAVVVMLTVEEQNKDLGRPSRLAMQLVRPAIPGLALPPTILEATT
jgi:exosome complex exonuclease DIS3/RRP44